MVRTVAYKGFAVLFDETDTSALDELLRDLTPQVLGALTRRHSAVRDCARGITGRTSRPVPKPAPLAISTLRKSRG